MRMMTYGKGGHECLADIEALAVQPAQHSSHSPPYCVLEYSFLAKDAVQAQTAGSISHPVQAGLVLPDLSRPPLSSSACVCIEREEPWRILACNRLWVTLTGFSVEESMSSTLATRLQGTETDTSTLQMTLDACAQQSAISVRLTCYDRARLPYSTIIHVEPQKLHAGVVLRMIPQIASEFVHPDSEHWQPVPAPQGLIAGGPQLDAGVLSLTSGGMIPEMNHLVAQPGDVTQHTVMVSHDTARARLSAQAMRASAPLIRSMPPSVVSSEVASPHESLSVRSGMSSPRIA